MQQDERRDDQADPPETRVAVLVCLGVVVAGFAWWVVALPPFSGRATIAVVVAGVAAMTFGTWERQRRRAADIATSYDRAGIATWALLVAVAGAWQLASYLQHPRADHPTVSSLTNAVLDSHLARAAAFVLWLAIARGLARR